MKVITAAPPAREGRHATELAHDEANARVVAFHLQAGQQVPPHRSDSTVYVHVTSGSGRFIGEDGEALLRIGESAVYAPGEMHSIEAGDEALRFIAVITPRPGG
jgi:quercetin dioxygenase-like cupin family protein